jgi:hypothetical protein
MGIPRRDRSEITADHAARYDALYVNLPRVPAAAVARHDCRLAVVARHGSATTPSTSGHDQRGGHCHAHAKLDAKTGRHDRLSFVLALAGRLFLKDRLTRTGRWHERMDNMGWD